MKKCSSASSFLFFIENTDDKLFHFHTIMQTTKKERLIAEFRKTCDITIKNAEKCVETALNNSKKCVMVWPVTMKEGRCLGTQCNSKFNGMESR